VEYVLKSDSNSDLARRAGEAAAAQEKRQGAAKRRGRAAERAGFKVAEFSASLGIDIATTHRWLNKGIVRAVHVGGLTIIPASELDRLLAEGSPRGRKRLPKKTADGKFIAKTGGAD
jgi:hypothetical protein